MALAVALAGTSAVPAAEAAPRGRGYDNHGGDRGHDRHHRGRGHYKNGKWIALGILGAAAAAAIANSATGGAGAIAIESVLRRYLRRVPARAGATLCALPDKRSRQLAEAQDYCHKPRAT